LKQQKDEQQQQQQGRRSKSQATSTTALPAKLKVWEWLGGSFKKASKGKGRKEFYKAIQRGQEILRVNIYIRLSVGVPRRLAIISGSFAIFFNHLCLDSFHIPSEFFHIPSGSFHIPSTFLPFSFRIL